MQTSMIDRLKQARARIAAEWTQLVMSSSRDNPLAPPETMVHLVGPALDRLFERLSSVEVNPPGKVVRGANTWPPRCACGRNPYLQFYVAGEQALMDQLPEEVMLAPRDIDQLRDQFRIVALEDIRLFGGMCQLVPAGAKASCG